MMVVEFDCDASEIQKTFTIQLIVSFTGSWETRTGFSQPQVHTVMVGQMPTGHDFLPITV